MGPDKARRLEKNRGRRVEALGRLTKEPWGCRLRGITADKSTGGGARCKGESKQDPQSALVLFHKQNVDQ